MANIKKKLEKLKQLTGDRFPKHVGLIIDGNRRWARKKGVSVNAGHYAGYETLKKLMFGGYADLGIKYLTIYTLSLENIRKRNPEEIEYIYDMIMRIVDDINEDKDENKDLIRFNVFGRLNVLPTEVREKIESLMEETKDHDEYFINLAIAYDGQEEIVDAVKKMLEKGIQPDNVSLDTIKKHLYTKDYPELDYIVRTGMKDGARISGFMLWDSSYAEFKFRDEYWPDYNEKMLFKDLKEYLTRDRRKGT